MVDGYMIKQQAAAISAAIVPDAESARLLRDALLRVADEPDAPGIRGYITEERIEEIFRGVLGVGEAGCWREYRLDKDAYNRRLCYGNVKTGSTIYISYYTDLSCKTQEILEAGEEAVFGGGRIYRPASDVGVDRYRTFRTIERL